MKHDLRRSELIQILIVDDHPVVRAGLRAVIETQPDLAVVAEAATGEEALDLVQVHAVDLVLIDLQMPGIGGAETISILATFAPAPPVVVLTTYGSDADILRALDAGAIGYLLKDAASEVLFDSIRGAVSGQVVLAPDIADRLAARKHHPDLGPLTSRELEVLEHVAKGQSNKEIALALFLSQATVKTHLVHVFSKLEVSTRTEAAARARDLGLIR